MAELVTKVIDSVTAMIKALEREGAALVEKMAEYATKAAVTLEQILKDAFDKVKRTLASIGRSFKARLKALEERRRTTPNGGSGFVTKLKSAASEAGKEMEVVLEKFTHAAKAIVSRTKEIIIKIATLVETTVADAGKFVSDAGKECFEGIKTIVEKGIKEAKTLAQDVEPSHTMDGSFTHTHDLEMAAGASAVLFDPILIGSFVLGVGIIAGANAYDA